MTAPGWSVVVGSLTPAETPSRFRSTQTPSYPPGAFSDPTESGSSSDTVIGWHVSGGINLPSESFRTMPEAYRMVHSSRPALSLIAR